MDTQTTGGVDMGKLRDSIESILNAIVQSTELAKQVEAMTQDVGQLRSDIDTTQARNVELDRMLHDTREQRDRAERELGEAKTAYMIAEHSLKERDEQNAGLNNQVSMLEKQLASVNKERDDYGFNAMAIQEALDKANAKLASIHQTMGIDFKPFEVPKPEPSPEPEPVVAKVTEPEVPSEAPKRKVYYGEEGFNVHRADDGWDGKSYQLV